MFVSESTHISGVLHTTTPDAVPPGATPVGGYGTVTVVGDDPELYLICRTERGRRGWGVHTADGTLLVSGWPTRTRAVAYAERRLTDTAGGAL